MPYIQIYDEEKECWVLKKVKEVPKVETPPRDSGWGGNVFYATIQYTFDQEVVRRLQELRGPRFTPVMITNTANDRYFVHDEVYTVPPAATHPVEHVARTPDPQPTYYPGSGEPPNRDEVRENIHARRVAEYKRAQKRGRKKV